MSDIYLTKIERKTIFTKSLIFVLILFVISDLTVTGPFYFNFIPWMYIIGMIGQIKRIDKILMGIISSFTVLIASIIFEGALNYVSVANTLVAIFLIILGIITGKIINEFILEHRLVKYIKPKRKIMYILISILFLILSFVLVGIKDGNIFWYLKSRNGLDKYINGTYNIENYNIKTVKFNRNVNNNYVYTVEIDGQVVNFVPVGLDIFKDSNLEDRLNDQNIKLQKEFEQKLQDERFQEYESLKNMRSNVYMEYTKPGINPDSKVLYLRLENVDDKEDLYIELNSFIHDVCNVEDVDKIVITINDNSIEISKDKIENIDARYLQGGFYVEELDEKQED